MPYSELEIVIQRDALDGFQANARQRLDEGDAITPFQRIELDVHHPDLLGNDRLVIGRLLTAALLGPPVLYAAFIEARTRASHPGLPLRIRLRIDPGAAILHGLPWETMVDPQEPTVHLLRNDKCVFSRYLFATQFHLPRLRPKHEVRALVAVASPQGLASQFAPIDVPYVVATAQQALHSVPVKTLYRVGEATLQNIMNIMSEDIDILYLVCHGAGGLEGQAPALWLDDGSGGAALVTGDGFVARIAALERAPSLVVLCSCQGAGIGLPGGNPLNALGPMLAKEGVPAILAMQGNVSLATAATFMPTFFHCLADHGQVDRAAAAARSQVMGSTDWWMPVIFTRLDSARIWYPPGFGIRAGDPDPWESIVGNLKAKACTPILGPAMNETLFGSRSDLARSWADIYRYPMGARETDDLARVAQYLGVTRQGVFPRREYYKSVYQHLLKNHCDDVPDGLRKLEDTAVITQLDSLVSSVGTARRKRDPDDPHTVLASLKLPVYITTDPSNLLVDALIEHQAKPRVRLVRWNAAAAQRDTDYVSAYISAAAEEGCAPLPARATPERPIVVKLFGDLSDPASLVMTEDQFFDYLTATAATKDIVPPEVYALLSNSSLLLLGFQADSWEFRVLLRSLLQGPGSSLLQDYDHFSVQIDPNSILDPASARRYIEKYLQAKAKLRLYWGDISTFTTELSRRFRGAQP